MTETEQKEQELVAGTIGGITQKKADTWTVQVTPDGSEYAKNLWTKSTTLVEALQDKLGQSGAFVCNASYWTRQDGQQVRSLWIESEAEAVPIVHDDGSMGVAPGPTKKPTSSVATHQPRVYTPDLKDRMIVRQACLKAAAALYTHRSEAGDLGDFPLQVMKAAQRFETWVYRDIDEPPFDLGDDSVPF